MRTTLLPGLLVSGLFLALPASAHESGLSYLDVRLDGALVTASLDAPAQDYTRGLQLDADRDGRLSQADIVASDAALRRWLFGSVRFVADEAICEGESFTPHLDGDVLLRLTGTWQCAGSVQRLDVATSALDTFGADHTVFARVARGDDVHQALLTSDASSATFDFGAPESWVSAAGRFIVLGVEHIFTGIDHVLFVLALILIGGRLPRIIGVASAFTVAHSITLSLAALQIVLLPSRLVESVIAASIGWVAVENWVLAAPRTEQASEPLVLRWRWLLTFVFGLMHGFGFAGVLSDLGLPPDHVPVALGAFNVGVELGQVAIIAAAYPMLRWATSKAWYRPLAVRVASGVMLAVAVYWFVQRAFALG